MSGCTDKRFRDLMHSYELGMLEGEELFRFERHLFDCEACFKEVEEFHRASRHLLGNRVITQTVEDFVNQIPESPDSRKSAWRFRGSNRRLVVLIPAAAILLIALLLKPWNVQIQPTREAVAAENRMLITCFEDLTETAGSAQIGEAVASLLLVDLAESHYLQVVSRERLFHALKARGIEGTCPPDRATAFDIAREMGTRWLLTGTIIQRQPNLILASELVDVSTGDVVATQRVIADAAENIFIGVDKLTVQVKRDLTLPSEAMSEFDPDLSDLTTGSPEAYGHYLEGVAFMSKMFYPEAIESFRAALRFDSTFSMVYYHLASLQNAELIDRAIEYSTDASPKEKYYIESRAALYSGNLALAIEWAEKLVERYPTEAGAYNLLGDYHYRQRRYEKAAEYYTIAAAEDPLFALPWNMLAYCYAKMGDRLKAIDAVDNYIALAPDEPNPYDSKAEILGLFGDLEAAINELERIVDERTSFLEPLSRLGMFLTFRGDYQRADSCFRLLTSQVDDARYWWVTIYRACLYARKAEFGHAIAILDSVVTAVRDGRVPSGPAVAATNIRASLLRGIGELDSAFLSIKHTVTIGNEPHPDLTAGFQNNFIRLVAEIGDTSGAADILTDLKALADQGRMQQTCYLTSRGYLEFSLGAYDSAAIRFEQAILRLGNPLEVNWYENKHMLALSRLRAGDPEQAIAEFEELQESYTYQRLLNPLRDVLSNYYLGIACEQSGRHREAILHYEAFLRIWENSDRDIDEVVDAKNRLERLEQAG